MAWRVKYRKLDSAGNVLRMRLPVHTLGCHPKNRGGVYASGLRCKGLCIEVVEAGFVKEEVDHAGVAVEETPLEDAASRGKAYVSGRAYNKEQSSKDENLQTCFQVPNDDVRHMLLAHNTIMLVLRAWLTRAKWDIPFDEQKQIKYCDDKGTLSIAAVAEHKNGKELELALQEGFLTEILSWKMDLEEPSAASTISQALNQGHQLALRTTELTAVAVLRGEIMLQSANLSQKVVFQSVREQVRRELHSAADDPDLIEVFEFLISLGVGTNSYVEDLEDFTKFFVNSKLRQLRFFAFANANAIPDCFPLVKVGVIKRAYRKKPSYGFCPSPETDWGKYEALHLKDLEAILRFFHGVCKDALDKLTPQSRSKTLGNIDVSCTETFYAAKLAKKNHEKIRESLLEATIKTAKELHVEGRKDEKSPWIDFSKVGQTPAPGINGTSEDPLKKAPVIIRFDESTGEQLNVQEELPQEKEKERKLPVKLPWREWFNNNESYGATAADKASAVAALHVLYDHFNAEEVLVDVWQLDGKIFVSTPAVAEQYEIFIPPFIPKQSQVFEKTEHPSAIKIVQKVMRNNAQRDAVLAKARSEIAAGAEEVTDSVTKQVLEAAEKEMPSVWRENIFYILPEFKSPTQEENSAVAASTTSTAPTWNWEGAETMNPFWAVRRLTDKQLQQEAQAWTPETGKPRPRFNCQLETQSLSLVNLGVVRSKALNRTRMLDVPFLTNNVALLENEELILEVQAMKKKEEKPKKRTWRDEVKDTEKPSAAKPAAKPKIQAKRSKLTAADD